MTTEQFNQMANDVIGSGTFEDGEVQLVAEWFEK